MHRPYRILLVEDNPADVEIALEAFRRSRGAVHIAVSRDGRDALDYLFQQGRYVHGQNAPRPDLILLDLNLPKLSGWELLELIKRHESLREIPVIVLTTSDRDADVRRCYRLGANSYLTKPVQLDEYVKLVALVQQYWLQWCKLPGL
ncbi:MAG: response regulator [Verrucomicrobiae bacterium]|nr:response regulator [Verrucomicrobiae bacterium]